MPSFRSFALLVAAVGFAVALVPRDAAAREVSIFARCIALSGAVFYGAHWCPACAKQKAAFGDAARLLPYVECYRPGTRKKLSRCKDVKKFPTWHLPDGSRHTGVKSFKELSRLTGCPLR